MTKKNTTATAVNLELGKSYDRLSDKTSVENVTENEIVWHSDNEEVVSVNPMTGYVFANGVGTATVYATSVDNDNVQTSYSVNVTEPVYVESVVVTGQGVHRLNRGDVHMLHAAVEPVNATNSSVRWHSNRPRVVSVNAITGQVTARSGGYATICAVAVDRGEVCGTYLMHVSQTSKNPTEEIYQNKVPGSVIANPIDVQRGAHLIAHTILSLYGGQGLRLTVHYNSTNLVDGEFGLGWYHNYDKRVVAYDDNTMRVYQGPSVYARYTALDNGGTMYRCESKDKRNHILTTGVSDKYQYAINCNSEYTEYYYGDGKLAKIVDHQGFETTIEYHGMLTAITDCVSGKRICLEKDAEGKIIYAYECNGDNGDNDDDVRVVTFLYDSVSNDSGDTNMVLTTICDVNGNAIKYEYDGDGRIVRGIDANNVCYFENTYDEYGRIVAQKDAIEDSMASTIIYDEEENKRIVKDRNGKVSIRLFNDEGLLIRNTDENGCSTCYVYDEYYNLVCETDAKGNSITKQYNAFNKPAEVEDRNGNITRIDYDSAGNVVRIRYPEVNNETPEETFVYNDRNQIVQHTDLRGTVTVYTYDANGMPATKKVGNRNAITYQYENGLLKSVTDARGYTTRYEYDLFGQVASKIDADNNTTLYKYDKCGNLLETTDANDNVIKTTYDCNYQKTSVTDANGNKTEYSYNGNMKNDTVHLPDRNTIHYEFDGEDRVIKITDQCDHVTRMTYDDGGRMTEKRFADGATVKYKYDDVGNVIRETNPCNANTFKTYDKAGNVLTVTDHEGNSTSYEYNAMSKVVKVTNAKGGTIQYEYSKAGDLLSETDAFGNRKLYTYDEYGNRLTETDARNNVTTYTYDQNGNLLTVQDALNHVTTYTYNSLNQCVSVKDAQNNTIYYGYDALGRRTTITDARGHIFTTTYDGNGNVVMTTDAKGNTVSETTYNSLNLPLTVTDAMRKTTTYTYNALGKVESVTDPLNHRTEFTYDSRGQNTEVLDAANHVSMAAYDLLGNVTRLAGPLGGATNYTYDNMGRLISESTVSGGTKNYEYNELNVRKKITNARGQVRQISYDVMGRITGYTSPEEAVSYTYDANGNVLTVTDSHGMITRTYDALNRVSSYTDTYGKTILYSYNEVGDLTQVTYPDNTTVGYVYDANHNLTAVFDWANRLASYMYDANNRVISVTKPDGSVTTTVYDDMQRVTSTMEKLPSGAVISGFEYTYDNLSRIIEEKVLANSTKMCYTYDELSRVTSRTIKDMSDNVLSEETFTYDAAGNLTGGSANTIFAYDTNNRLVLFNSSSVNYDFDGNMLSNGALSCTYDSANRLISAGGHTYTYNAEDVRIRNLCEDEDTTYTYNTNAKLSQLLMKTTNGVVTKYVYGKGLIGEEVSGAFKTYHFDCRGSTIAITDASGNITDTFAYDTYGKLISRTGTSKVIFGYNGRDGVVTDDNGLIYMRARYYSPDMRRFINADVIAGAISNAITLNRFAYANGNPVSFVDPFGLIARPPIPERKPSEEDEYRRIVVDYRKKAVEWLVDKCIDVYEDVAEVYKYTCNAVNNRAKEVLNDAMDLAVSVGDFIADTVFPAVVDGSQKVAKWTNKKVIEPAVESISKAGKRIKDGFETAINAIVDNVGAKASAGREETTSLKYYYFATVEKGVGYTKSFGNDKPVTFFASAGEKWWEFWEWSVGADVNINGYGVGCSIGGEASVNIHAGNVSHEVGRNMLGRISHKVVYSEGDSHAYVKYSLNEPETVAAVVVVAAVVYFGWSAVAALAAVAGGAVPVLA